MTSFHVKRSTCNSWVLYSPATIADSSSQASHAVMKHHFSEHVKAMHEKKDYGFEKEFQVCLCTTTDVTRVSYEPFKFYQFNPFKLHPHAWVLILQTIATVPDGVMDTAKANSAKNRYLNIHTCESENAKVYVLLFIIYMSHIMLTLNWLVHILFGVQSLILDLLTND